MTEPDKDSKDNKGGGSARSEAQSLLDAIGQIRAKAEEYLAATELARKTADSEALFAFNAKKTCEDHSTAISALKGTVETDVNGILANKQRSDELIAALNTGKASIDTDQKTISDCRKDVEKAAQEIMKAAENGMTHLTEIISSNDSAESTLQKMKDALAATTQASSAAEEARNQTDTVHTQSSAILSMITENQTNARKDSDEIHILLLDNQKSDANLKAVWEHLKESDETARTNEQRIAKYVQDLEGLTKRIEGLLPGATSAGLASSFNAQKARFKGHQKQWLWTFVGCMAGLLLAALPSFLAAIGIFVPGHPTEPTWEATLRSLALRLPIVLPLVWLAVYAARNYMLSIRLEEDYAYKEAISTAFEGYKREMERIVTGEGQGPSPITTLCTNILRAIAERPGRIYEGKQQDINLLSEATALLQKGADLSKRQIADS